MGAHETEIIARTALELNFAGGDQLIYATDGNFWSYDSKNGVTSRHLSWSA